jgi:hypothetical protein
MKFAFLSVLLISQAALAAAVDNEEVVVIKKPAVVEDSSEFHRMGKEWQATAQLLGMGAAPTGSTGVSIGKFINRNQLILLDFMNGSGSGKFFWVSEYEVKTNSVGAYFKHYTGNSFYYRAGLDYNRTEYKHTYRSTYNSDWNSNASFDGQSLNVGFAIGNQWQWENFTLGCDWVGVSVPVSSQISNESLNSGSLSLFDRKDLEDDEDLYVRNGHAQLLRFYLGASF